LIASLRGERLALDAGDFSGLQSRSGELHPLGNERSAKAGSERGPVAGLQVEVTAVTDGDDQVVSARRSPRAHRFDGLGTARTAALEKS
jgi:hypothetical protein